MLPLIIEILSTRIDILNIYSFTYLLTSSINQSINQSIS